MLDKIYFSGQSARMRAFYQMSNRIKGLTVTLKPNMRDDDALAIISAIRLLNGVVDVVAHVAGSDHHMAVAAAKFELQRKATLASVGGDQPS